MKPGDVAQGALFAAEQATAPNGAAELPALAVAIDDTPPPFREEVVVDGAPSLTRSLSELFDEVPDDWRPLTEAFRLSAAGQGLIWRVDAARLTGAPIYPDDVFAALKRTRRADVRALILGQDPYHGPGQAHGLAFSVRPGIPIPPSLRNIRKEIQRDLGLTLPAHGCLQTWAGHGVLLLNSVLTVEAGHAASHAGWGWEALTDGLIAAVAADPGPKVFMLWGAHAQRKSALIEEAVSRREAASREEVLVLQCNHPSPLSETRGPAPFVGCGHFGRAAAFLQQKGQRLNWSLA